MKPIYIRTDKNGTKIYHDYTCPRCCGYGMLDKWINTGKVCYACGGSGKRSVPKVVKEYTPEYWAKLDAKRNAKAAKKAEEAAKYAEEHAEEIAAANRQALINRYAMNGLDANGIGYVLIGKTYQIKDQIKKSGGKWVYGQWICPVEIQAKDVKAVRIEVGLNEYGNPDPWEAIENVVLNTGRY